MGIPYRISKSLLGDKVHYKCPGCKAELRSKFSEIGSSDYCPICGAGFTVPGEDEARKREGNRRRREEENLKREEEDRKRQEEKNRQIVPARPMGAIQAKGANLPQQLDRPVQTVLLSPAARSSGDMKTCPFCGEDILLEAKKCKHCGEIIDIVLRAATEAKRAQELSMIASRAAAPTGTPPSAPVVTQIVNVGVGRRWSPLAAMLLSLIVPGLGQIYKGQPFNGVAWFVIVATGYFFLIVPGLVLHLCCILGAGMGDPNR